MVPWLLALIIVDVAIRRIAWDWPATKKMALAVANYVQSFTMTYRKVESPQMLDSLKRVREEVAEQKFKGTAEPAGAGRPVIMQSRPDPRAKFEAGPGVDGELTSVVGGATDKPVPTGAAKSEPKGAVGLGEHVGGLLEAKRRAQQKIRQKQDE